MIETLEHRLAFADVTVVAAGGGVTVMGSDGADEILLERRGGQIALVGGGDTTVNGNPEFVLDAEGAVRGVTFHMRGGDNSVRLIGQMPDVPVLVYGSDGSDQVTALKARLRALDIYSGRGSDRVNLERVTLRGALRIFGGIDGTLNASLFELRGGRNIHIDASAKTVSLEVALAEVGNANITTGPKQDTVKFSSTSAQNVTVDLGGGSDSLYIGAFNGRAMDIFAGTGIDEVNVIGATMSHRLRVSMGSGRDLLRVDNSTLLRGMDFADQTAGRFYLTGTRLAGTPSVFASNARTTVVATNSRFAELQLALRGEGSTTTLIASPVDKVNALQGNQSSIDKV